MDTPEGDVVASDWAEGFLEAVQLRADAWERLFQSETFGDALLPILALCCDEEGEPLLPLPEEMVNQFLVDAEDLIPASVLQIAAFWRAAPAAPRRRPAGPKTGRNDPCPCGSAKKFKKCCGADS